MLGYAVSFCGELFGKNSNEMQTEEKSTETEIQYTENTIVDTDSEKETAAQETVQGNNIEDTDVDMKIYHDVLEEYRDMVLNNFYMDLRSGDYAVYENSFGPDIGQEIRLLERSVFYAFFDVDGNGIDELIIAADEPEIGADSPEFSPLNYDLYTYSEGRVVHVFNDYEFGYRTNFELYGNGIIEVSYTSSAAEYGVEYYRIGENGVTPELINAFSCVGAIDNDGNVTFTYYEKQDEITETVYQEKTEDYEKPIAALEWKEIN